MTTPTSTKVIEAIKKIYPSIDGGFVYFETQPNGAAWNNSIDGLVWENQSFTKPTWSAISAKFTEVEDDIALITAKQERIAARQVFVDTYRNDILKEVIAPNSLPQEIKSTVSQAIDEIKAIEESEDPETINNFPVQPIYFSS